MPKIAESSSPAKLRKGSTAGRVEVHRHVLTPMSWIDAATDVLVDHGISHVRIDVLAGQLGVTRGSFYWHFRDRDDLLAAVLANWRTKATEDLTRRLASAASDPRMQIRDLISLPFRGRAARRVAGIELAIRMWARRDDAAREAVDRCDAIRLAYHAQLFVALGYDEAEAGARAFLLYGYEIAESLMPTQGTAAQRKARALFVERLIQEVIRP